ncbi:MULTISPECIES: ribose-5-phosphate isomerase RpiA [unclassified Methylophilus]|uniref:ribose-5-phosphate isomerase RpiA n=1 Tax=unclassified Methylophilus TaxID=2630143 RepID=UPI0006FEE81C|nr:MULTISPECIES: ribose-5-phosphate isomerase RpiA [unclassified Methylophilus]KQT41610.1 ribose 5-phosphate isomerase [Methylophilus sp. Leaf416]KQT55776.1 ribose 5-phosphate isomerase [Methylophilus sp. Leaf459]
MNDKQAVALEAASYVKNDMIVGLGTGSTANYFIEALAARQQEENLRITTVASSNISMIKAQSVGLTVLSLAQLSQVDLYVDGADEITADNSLLKGRGYDLVMEKLLAKAAKEFIVVADKSKLVSRIGENFPIPIEVIPFAWQAAKRSIEAIGGTGDLRPNAAKDGLCITSHGSLVLDMRFDANIDSHQLNALLNNIPGVVEHGIFAKLASKILIADQGKVETRS